ncbi:MAG: MoaD/ThiS family protein [Bacteroidota bacterium]
MAKINFTTALQRFFPDLKSEELEGSTVKEILDNLEQKYPTITDYLIDEEGSLRKHINIFVGEKMIKDRDELSDQVAEHEEVLVFQALSGG